MCYYKIFNSADYGVPQKRNRCYIIAFRGEFFNIKDFKFPTPVKLSVTTQDLLDEDVPAKYFLSKRRLRSNSSRLDTFKFYRCIAIFYYRGDSVLYGCAV